MNITCYAIVVDNCTLSVQELQERIRKLCIDVPPEKSFSVREGYYEKERRIIVHDLNIFADIAGVVDMLTE